MICSAVLALLFYPAPAAQNLTYGEAKTYETPEFKKDGKVESIRITYKWVISLTQGDSENGPNPTIVCTNRCLGKKHKAHKECDASCDEACTEKHILELHGSAIKHTKQLMDRFDEVAKLWFGNDSKNLLPYSKLTDLAYEKYNEEVARLKLLMDYSDEIDHFAKPCSSASAGGFYEGRDIGVSMTAEIKVDGTTRKTGENFAFVGTIYVPNPDKKLVNNVEKCACEEAKPKVTDEHGSRPIQEPGAYCSTTDGGTLPFGDDTCTVEVAGCGNINEIEFKVTNHTDKPLIFTIDPGTICIGPDLYQKMLIAEFNRKNIPGKTPFASVSEDGAEQPVVFRVPAVCIEMSKETPAAGAPYKLLNTAPDGLAALGRIIDSGSIHGPWDQAMIWTWTDNASLEDTNKRLLFPKCPPGYYLWALSNVAKFGCKPIKSFQRFVSNDFLLAWDAKTAPTRWLIQNQAEFDPTGLASAVEQGFPAMAAKLKSDGPLSDIQHVADVAAGLCNTEDPHLQILGLRILAEVVPAGDQIDMVRKGALDTLPLLMISHDTDVSGKATSVAQQYLPKIDSIGGSVASAIHSLLTVK